MAGETTREKLAALYAIIDPLETPSLPRKETSKEEWKAPIYHEWNTDVLNGSSDDDA
jgi:hypothetical protein